MKKVLLGTMLLSTLFFGTELKKEHIGQIEVYMNYIDKNIKKINQDKTIGIIICKKDNKYVLMLYRRW